MFYLIQLLPLFYCKLLWSSHKKNSQRTTTTKDSVGSSIFNLLYPKFCLIWNFVAPSLEKRMQSQRVTTTPDSGWGFQVGQGYQNQAKATHNATKDRVCFTTHFLKKPKKAKAKLNALNFWENNLKMCTHVSFAWHWTLALFENHCACWGSTI